MVDLPPQEKVLIVYVTNEEVGQPQVKIMFYPRKKLSYGQLDTKTIEHTPTKSRLSTGKPLDKGAF
jgi:hypothetical protein